MITPFALLAGLVLASLWVSADLVPTAPRVPIQRLLTSLQRTSFALTPILLMPAISRSKTVFDIEVYGDKELKIAALNKLKQSIRNEILAEPNIASSLLELAVNDALGFNVATGDGGSDGSVIYETDKGENEILGSTINLLVSVKRKLQRTVSFSLADVCAVAGAEALESVGCPRIPVQLGRFDAKDANKKKSSIVWTEPSAASIFDAFNESGLGTKDAVLLIGAVCEVQRIVSESGGDNNSDAKGDEGFEKQPFVPESFGARDATFGEKVGTSDFGPTYFTNLLKETVPEDSLGRCLLSSTGGRVLVEKYAQNGAAFRKDVVDSYLRLTKLGETYTTRNS